MIPEDQRMTLWNAHKDPPEEFTKKVEQRGGFTAINAQYQIRCATEMWGPLGTYWKIEVEWEYYPPAYIAEALAGDLLRTDMAVIAHVKLTYPCEGNTVPTQGTVHAEGACKMYGSARVDTDAHKKARTDGTTKALSMLGISSSVFLGLWDDNKYVAEVAQAPKRIKAKAKPKPKPEEKPVVPENVTATEKTHIPELTAREWSVAEGNNLSKHALRHGCCIMVRDILGSQYTGHEVQNNINEIYDGNTKKIPFTHMLRKFKKVQNRWKAVQASRSLFATDDDVLQLIESEGGVMKVEPDAIWAMLPPDERPEPDNG